MDAKNGVQLPSKSELLAAGLSEDQIAAVLSRMGMQAGGPAPAEQPGMDITPTAAFVVKTHIDTVDAPKANVPPPPAPIVALCKPGVKVFLNLCSHGSMPGMSRMNRPKAEGGEEEGIRVPIAVGPLKTEKDNAGTDCLAVDLVMHPDVIRDCDRDGTGGFRHWLVQLGLQYCRMKHGLGCNAQYALPKLKYKGAAVTSQRIRVEKPAGIQEVRPDDGTAGGTSASPMGLLAQAGALPEQATALAMPQKGMRGVQAPVPARPVIPKTTNALSQMDIRLVHEERAAEQEGLVGQMAREAQQGAAGRAGDDSPSGPSLLRQAGKEGDGGSEERSGPSSAGLQESSTRRLPVLREPSISAVVDLEQQDDGVSSANAEAEDGSGPSARQQPLACPVAGTRDTASGALAVKVGLPTGPQGEDLAAMPHAQLLLTIELPLASNPTAPTVGQAVDPKSIRLVGKGSGEAVLLEVPGYRPTTIRLPFKCSFVAQAKAVEGAEDGPAAAISGKWDSQASVLTLSLPRRMDASASLPSLPSTCPPVDPATGSLPAPFLALLRQYVEAGAGVFEPDPGSRPWLLAQALAGEDKDKKEKGKDTAKATDSTKAAATVKPASSTASTKPDEEELPEDRFLKQDALSLHFLQQREADKAARIAKDKEREGQPLVKEVTYEPGRGTIETPADIPGYPSGRPAAEPADGPTAGAGGGQPAQPQAIPQDSSVLLEDLV